MLTEVLSLVSSLLLNSTYAQPKLLTSTPSPSLLSKRPRRRRRISSPDRGTGRRGVASYYGKNDGFHGRRAADGSRFDAHGLTAAHNSLPFGTRVRVTNISNGRSVVVRITDRGGFGRLGREIDLSYGAAKKLGMVQQGLANVRIQVLGK